MFGNRPSSSPASYPGDESFLQRAVAAGHGSLTGAFSNGDDSQAARGRSSKRHSRSSTYSNSNSVTRLSPTRESDGSELDTPVPSRPTSPVAVDERTALLAQSHRHSHSPGVPDALAHPAGYGTHEDVAISTGAALRADGAVVEVALPDRSLGQASVIRGEAGILLGYLLPIAGTHFLEYSLLVVTVVSVGHIGTTELAAASLASMTSNVVALSVISGFCTALDTLCPQAFTSRPSHTSLHALRTFYILMLLVIPQCIIFYNSRIILLWLRQDPDVAAAAALYLKVLAFGMPGYAGFECVRRWLQAQGLMLAPVIALIFAAPFNALLNYLLVWGPFDAIRIGFVGAPLATALSMNVMFGVSLIYAIYFAPREAWGGFSKDIFCDLGDNIRLGLAGTAMTASEWWSWEIVGLASSFLGPEALAAQSVLLTSASLFYQIPYALSVAGAVRVGNLLGAQRPKLAQTAARVTMGLAIGIAGVNSILLVALRYRWGRLFSSEPEVIAIVAQVLPLVALFQLSDGLSGATGGLLRGAGKATWGAIINLVSYYALGIPVGIALAFTGPKLGLEGLWVGLTLALTGTGVLTSAVIWRMNWSRASDQARIRAGVAKRDEEEE